MCVRLRVCAFVCLVGSLCGVFVLLFVCVRIWLCLLLRVCVCVCVSRCVCVGLCTCWLVGWLAGSCVCLLLVAWLFVRAWLGGVVGCVVVCVFV